MNKLLLRRRALMMVQKKSRLPSEYQEVEYLESTGTQYIDTGYIPNYYTTITGKFLHTENVVDTPLFGVRGPNTVNSYLFWAHPIEYRPFPRNKVIFNDYTHDFTVGYPVNTIEEFYYSNSVMRCNNETFNYTARRGTPNLPLILFGLSNNGSVDSRKFVGKIFEFVISEDGQLIRNFIPCYRKSDNKPGMYDLVSKTLFTNQGTNEFIVGADVK